MADEDIPKTFLEKLLFYTTATFILLATFSLFAFLFLVPFVIDPAFTTIFMQFDTNPATCVTAEALQREGASNCSWASCREGCTKDIYECLQIRVHYKRAPGSGPLPPPLVRNTRAIREYDYGEASPESESMTYEDNEIMHPISDTFDAPLTPGLQGNDSEWFFVNAKLFPNVKGCGYPPFLNCTIFLGKYKAIGTNFSCYYSKVDPGLVISDLDMWQNTLNLVYATAIPIPSFIVSIIYLTIAYFKIYNEDEEAAPLERNAEGMAGGGEEEGDTVGVNGIVGNTGGDTPGSDTFREDLASFGHQVKGDVGSLGGGDVVKQLSRMCSRSASQGDALGDVDGIGSRCSLDVGNVSNSGSIPGKPIKLISRGETISLKSWAWAINLFEEDSPSQSRLKSRNPYKASCCFMCRLLEDKRKQKLEQDDDNEYLNSTWSDSGSLSRQCQGLSNISWKPK